MARFSYNESNAFFIHVMIYVYQFCVLTARMIKEELNLVSTQTAMNSLVPERVFSRTEHPPGQQTQFCV